MGWLQRRRERRHCLHPRQRCVHGDEINHVGGYRGQYLDCGRYLPDLPAVCSASGRPHHDQTPVL